MGDNGNDWDQKCKECGFEVSGLYAYAEMRRHMLDHEWWKNNITDADKDFLRVNRIAAD